MQPFSHFNVSQFTRTEQKATYNGEVQRSQHNYTSTVWNLLHDSTLAPRIFFKNYRIEQ